VTIGIQHDLHNVWLLEDQTKCLAEGVPKLSNEA
jgi:hypothetical protein